MKETNSECILDLFSSGIAWSGTDGGRSAIELLFASRDKNPQPIRSS